jgi:trigger factor
LKSEIKSSDGLVREIEVEIPVEKVDAAFAELYQKYRKEVKVKGFRPGKVPLSIVRSRFGEAIKNEVLQDLIGESYPEVIREHKLKVASPPDIPKYDLKEGSPLVYTAKFEVIPEIEKVDYENLELPDEEVEVRDAEVDAVIEHLRRKAAEIRGVDRPATEEDVLQVDLIKTDDPDKVLDADKFEDIELDLSSHVTVNEFRKTLKGIKAGEEREVKVDYAQDFSNERLAGKSITYLCKVRQVKERVLPPENDAFAKSQGKVETMLELRLKIREDLKVQKELEQKQWEKQEIIRQIVGKNQIPIPESMINRYIDSVIKDMKEKKEAFDEKEVREQYRPIAADAIRRNWLIGRLAEIENIEVLPSDTEVWIKEFADRYQMEPDKAKEILSKAGKFDEIRDSILEEKVVDFLSWAVKRVPVVPEATITAGSDDKSADNEKDEEEKTTEVKDK